jgi:hypothetical protein
VSGLVINDQMHVENFRNTRVHMAQKVEEFLVSMMALTLAQDRLDEGVEGPEQSGGAVPGIVVRDSFDIAEPQGQHRLAPLQRLNLALLVRIQDQSLSRWVQVQPDNVQYPLDEERIVRKLKVTRSVGLQAEGAPDLVNGRFRETRFRQCATTPVRAVVGFGSQGSADQRGDLFVGDRTREDPSYANLKTAPGNSETYAG